MPTPIAATSNLAFDERPRGAGNTGATEQIARTLRDSGIDAPTGLFDEALALAQDGHLSPAAERLRMLLCLDPADAEASLLLGKILSQRGQFQEALANLDAAVTHGAVLPPGLREDVESGLKRKIREAEEHRARVAARERGEVQTLRQEAKKLRSENAALELEVDELQRRVRTWTSATAVVAGGAAALLLGFALFGGDSAPSAGDAAADEALAAEVLTPTPVNVVDQAAPAAAAPVAAAPAAAAPAAAVEKVDLAKPAAPAAGAAKTHTVGKGDTLGKIANQYYGKSSDWPLIQKANRDQLGDGVDLKLGMKLKIPAQP